MAHIARMLRSYQAAYVIALAVSMATESIGAPSLAAEIPKKIDEKIALKLVANADGRKASDFRYVGDDKLSSPFFVFQGVSKQPAEGSFGSYAVNPWTGDVWALRGCYKLVSDYSRGIQIVDILKRFTPEELKQYGWLSRLKPTCISEDAIAKSEH
ncbi:MAG TPA: hypothetical protein VKY65_19195 [Alphaproteobacteria bacterium]|nr:hypothetical protein [Alphaproteobacteria bacterium]